MNGQLFLPYNNATPIYDQQTYSMLEADVKELNRLKTKLEKGPQKGYIERDYENVLDEIDTILTELNSKSLSGIDILSFTSLYIDTVVYIAKSCIPLTESSDKISRMRESIIKEGINRFNMLPNRLLDLNSLELRAYEYFVKADSLPPGTYGQPLKNFNLFDNLALEQSYAENKQYFLSLLIKHHTGQYSLFSQFTTPAFSNEVMMYRKLQNL